MKFSEIEPDSWAELQPYLDTCLIPLSGLTGEESPWEATNKVARTGQWLVPVEKAFYGRTVTMPAYHYNAGDGAQTAHINRLIDGWRGIGFRYVIVISGQLLDLSEGLNADLLIQPEEEEVEPNVPLIKKSVTELWQKPKA